MIIMVNAKLTPLFAKKARLFEMDKLHALLSDPRLVFVLVLAVILLMIFIGGGPAEVGGG